MKILAFESSCDETAVAVVEDGRTVLSDAIASQADLHALYGGVVPEIASRKHVEAIAALTDQALRQAGCEKSDIDAVAVTYAPGLIGAVLVGLSFAKSVAFALGVPLIPVHHIRGHIAANYLAFPELEPPFLALAISGGNTMIVDVRDYTDMEILGATRDDAAGECFDKAARVLGLPYPGGAPMDALARQSPGSRPCGRGRAGHELLRPQDGGGEPGPPCSAGGGVSGPGSAGSGLRPGCQRYTGAPGHGGGKADWPHCALRRRRRSGQLRHPGGSSSGLRGGRHPVIPAAAETLRRQRCHDRRPGVL